MEPSGGWAHQPWPSKDDRQVKNTMDTSSEMSDQNAKGVGWIMPGLAQNTRRYEKQATRLKQGARAIDNDVCRPTEAEPEDVVG